MKAFNVELVYPPRPDEADVGPIETQGGPVYVEVRNTASVIVGASLVRCVNDLKITFDFERNGWSISRATVFNWSIDDEECDPCWKEDCFIPYERGR